MSRVPGVELESVWEGLDDAERRHIAEQISSFIRIYRAIPPPPGETICSVIGGPITHSRVLFHDPAGPFIKEDHFNFQLRCGAGTECAHSLSSILHVHAKRHPLVFTHGDLAPRNIMVQGRSVTAIVDWGSSGWYPAHMEYCLTKNWGWCEPWVSWVDDIVEPYSEEALADKELLEHFWVPQSAMVFDATVESLSSGRKHHMIIELHDSFWCELLGTSQSQSLSRQTQWRYHPPARYAR